MAKEQIRCMTGVFAAVFAHLGHISKEEAKEISGLGDEEFEKVYAKASNIAGALVDAKGKKMNTLLDHFGKEIDHWMKDIDPIF